MQVKAHSRITGEMRTKLGATIKKEYEQGQPIRAIANSIGRSYGFVHRILLESGAKLRGRGGNTRRKRKQQPK